MSAASTRDSTHATHVVATMFRDRLRVWPRGARQVHVISRVAPVRTGPDPGGSRDAEGDAGAGKKGTRTARGQTSPGEIANRPDKRAVQRHDLGIPHQSHRV